MFLEKSPSQNQEISTFLSGETNFFDMIITFIIIIIASREDEMNDKYNDKLFTSNEVIQWNEWGD